jgi:hypothetical protein
MGEPYVGAEVDVRTDVPLGVSVGIGRSMVRYGEAAAGSDEETVALRVAWTLFADDVLTGWNLYDRQGVLPSDASAFGRVSPRFITQLLGLWVDLMIPEASDAE